MEEIREMLARLFTDNDAVLHCLKLYEARCADVRGFRFIGPAFTNQVVKHGLPLPEDLDVYPNCVNSMHKKIALWTAIGETLDRMNGDV